MAKKFFYVCAGLFLLAGAFALGARSVEAQVGGDFVGISYAREYQQVLAITSNGEIYGKGDYLKCDPSGGLFWNASDTPCSDWQYVGNIMDGPVSSEHNSLGGVKSQYR